MGWANWLGDAESGHGESRSPHHEEGMWMWTGDAHGMCFPPPELDSGQWGELMRRARTGMKGVRATRKTLYP